MATHDLTELLEREGVSYELLPHRHTETAGQEAAVLGVDPEEVAKTIVLAHSRGHVRAVIPASRRLDVHKLRELLDLHDQPQLVHEDELAADYPSFELGATPPFGGPSGDRVAVDRRIADRDSVVFEAGSHDESVRLGTTDLLVLARAAVGDLCHIPTTSPGRTRGRSLLLTRSQPGGPAAATRGAPSPSPRAGRCRRRAARAV